MRANQSTTKFNSVIFRGYESNRLFQELHQDKHLDITGLQTSLQDYYIFKEDAIQKHLEMDDFK